MTTNHPERLDPALTRPGRADMKINMGPVEWQEARQIFLMLLQYKHDPSAAVRNVKRLLFGFECDTDLSAFRITESPHQLRLHDTAYCIRVPTGSFEEQDKTPRDALEREVRKETGLQLSRVIHALPIQTWTRSKDGEQHEWVGLPYIIEVSELEHSISHENRQGVSGRAQKWKDVIQLNPKEHQDFAWATEDEVRRDKYEMFGNHKETILEAFATVTQNCSV
ncbi:hypothetical protein BDV37DRAFT_264442 [Aspergillus pseudonomiae]|uniref:Nudix hydrolase domain-containing protein n=1 Tax=Aspergillus pseudonomiae TaxID=1506151 RepID=A0A5N7CUV1_9EURO|nr:uncharacterized protein BDV37DRAFT_264442 [Aspergillus pseudonomiae]KAE8397986.1 hypothetical protein BDV37DRAFT_264442 [Aspergillus pseudonomiae]